MAARFALPWEGAGEGGRDHPRQEFYNPIDRGFEREIKKRLEYWEKLRRKKAE